MEVVPERLALDCDWFLFTLTSLATDALVSRELYGGWYRRIQACDALKIVVLSSV
jgi:hypothetical protein